MEVILWKGNRNILLYEGYNNEKKKEVTRTLSFFGCVRRKYHYQHQVYTEMIKPTEHLCVLGVANIIVDLRISKARKEQVNNNASASNLS